MLKIIPISIDIKGTVKKDDYIIAMQNENESITLSILLPEKISNKWLYIEFETEDTNKIATAKLEAVRNLLEYNLTKAPLSLGGKLKCQVIAKDESGIVWKSNVFDFLVPKSINATEEMVKENPDVIADLQRQIDEINTNGVQIEEIDPTIPEYVRNITEEDINKWNNGGGGSAAIPIIEIEGSKVTLEPNKHYIIKGITNSLTISLSEPITTELKHYSFEFSSIDRIPTVTINGVDQPYNYEYAKETKFLCEIVNNHLVILGTYDGYKYQFIYGMFASPDYISSYTFKNDRTFTEILSGVTKTGTYQIELSNEQYTGILTYEDSSIKMFTYSNGTITVDGVVYTKLS